eukprot:360113-Chlamydomonas_euryale.AAC.8
MPHCRTRAGRAYWFCRLACNSQVAGPNARRPSRGGAGGEGACPARDARGVGAVRGVGRESVHTGTRSAAGGEGACPARDARGVGAVRGAGRESVHTGTRSAAGGEGACAARDARGVGARRLKGAGEQRWGEVRGEERGRHRNGWRARRAAHIAGGGEKVKKGQGRQRRERATACRSA